MFGFGGAGKKWFGGGGGFAFENFGYVLTTNVSDANAQSFITAAGISNQTQKNAINQLVISLKAASIWTKMVAVYPMVGGAAASHKFNLKDPRDLDAAFRLSFVGGWTHSATGALPNGTSAYASTFLVPNVALANNDTHLSYYSRTDISNDGFEIGAVDGANTNQMALRFASAGGNYLCDTYGGGTNRINTAVADSLGLFIDTRTSSVLHKAFKRGTLLGTDASASANLTAISVAYTIGAQSATGGFSSRQCAFASIGAGLADADVAALTTAVTAYQTALSRNV